MTARLRLFEALAAAGVPAAEADLLVSQLEASAVAGAHTCVSEGSVPHGSNQPAAAAAPPAPDPGDALAAALRCV